MRVLAVMPVGRQRGGAEGLLLEFARRAASVDVELHVVFLEPGPLVSAVRRSGATAHVVPASRLTDLRSTLRAARAVGRTARRLKPDVTLGWMTKAVLYLAPACAALRIPLVMYQQGTSSSTSVVDRLATACARAGVIAVSEAAAQAQRRLWPSRPVSVVAPGADLDRFRAESLPTPAELRAELDLPLATALVTMVSRLQRWKGVHVLIEALPAVVAAHPDLHVVIVGGAHETEPGYRAELEALARGGEVEDRVQFVGLQAAPERFMQASDVVVHASDNEPFGMVIIEAMALGKPVIAADSGGPVEIITPEVDGVLTAVGDARALASALTRLLGDEAARSRIGHNARLRAQAYAGARYAQRLAEALDAASSAA